MLVETGKASGAVEAETTGVLVESDVQTSKSDEEILMYDIEHMGVGGAVGLSPTKSIDFGQYSKDGEFD